MIVIEYYIEYYRSPGGREPVKEFIDALTPKDRSCVLRGLSLLEEFWPRLGMPHVRSLSGQPGLWELRVERRAKDLTK